MSGNLENFQRLKPIGRCPWHRDPETGWPKETRSASRL